MPWLPPEDPRLARFINEIILGEESDEDGRGGFASHYQLYLQAMRQAGANTGPIERLLLGSRAGRPIGECLPACGAPPPSVAFVHSTFDTIATGDLPRIAASFTFGAAKTLLPGVFHRIAERLDQQTGGRFQILRYYLVHMEVDGEHHGPLACRLMESACKTPEDWHAAASAARQALEARLALWDGIERALGSPGLSWGIGVGRLAHPKTLELRLRWTVPGTVLPGTSIDEVLRSPFLPHCRRTWFLGRSDPHVSRPALLPEVSAIAGAQERALTPLTAPEGLTCRPPAKPWRTAGIRRRARRVAGVSVAASPQQRWVGSSRDFGSGTCQWLFPGSRESFADCNSYTVEGIVFDASGDPVEGVRVCFAGPRKMAQASTGRDGFYRLSWRPGTIGSC
ncbi:MAG: DUF3050 domain-containing protein [Planctomycetota bacterium]